jgi:hypothetical protein
VASIRVVGEDEVPTLESLVAGEAALERLEQLRSVAWSVTGLPSSNWEYSRPRRALVGASHGWGEPDLSRTIDETYAFFDHYLKPKDTAAASKDPPAGR